MTHAKCKTHSGRQRVNAKSRTSRSGLNTDRLTLLRPPAKQAERHQPTPEQSIRAGFRDSRCGRRRATRASDIRDGRPGELACIATGLTVN